MPGIEILKAKMRRKTTEFPGNHKSLGEVEELRQKSHAGA